ncbi:LuxR C-terminal-related transcriptional regulator [Melittangium boletus]|uniref:HTH luxR-type domain-containing protein n=1 Tax=Melittangium boletus DSM 14713 TaxID=1294270 RepID=A0A250INT0_9BACT|nr:LuxR C-terminal-related transcriptional regulator [Melittangium boletus]ATB32913.1 hypothetical protein MEBOL_006402 [Melittangium boletus DSM 14713]
MRRESSRTKRKPPLVKELSAALRESLHFSELYESSERALRELFQTEHIALCMSNPDKPTAYDWRTKTTGALFRDHSAWGPPRDFVLQGVTTNPNEAMRDTDILRGGKVEDTQTYLICRANGLPFRRVISMLVTTLEQGVHGGITLYSERRDPFSVRHKHLLQEFQHEWASAFRNIWRYSNVTSRNQLLEEFHLRESTSLVLNSRGKEELRTKGVSALLKSWFDSSALNDEGIPFAWMERLATLVKADGRVAPKLYSLRHSDSNGELKVEFIECPRLGGWQLWELKLQDTRRSQLIPEKWLPHLTPRQWQIVNGVIHGDSNKTIATDMGITDDTVKKQLNKVYKKLGCDSRTDLTSRALRP